MNKLLVNRLDKRIAIFRPYGPEDYLSSAGNEETFELSEDTEFCSADDANVLFNALVDPDAPATDDYGEPIDGYIPVCTVWGAIEPLRGREFFAAQAEHSEVTTRIRIRYRKGIDRTMIVRYGDTEFEILYIIHPEFAKHELQLMCKERQ